RLPGSLVFGGRGGRAPPRRARPSSAPSRRRHELDLSSSSAPRGGLSVRSRQLPWTPLLLPGHPAPGAIPADARNTPHRPRSPWDGAGTARVVPARGDRADRGPRRRPVTGLLALARLLLQGRD